MRQRSSVGIAPDSNRKVVKPWLTPDAVARRMFLKTPNAILGPSNLPVVVSYPDKRLQTGPFCVEVVWQTQNIMVHTREEDVIFIHTSLHRILVLDTKQRLNCDINYNVPFQCYSGRQEDNHNILQNSSELKLQTL